MNTIAPRSIRRRVGSSLLGCLFLSFVAVAPASQAQDAPVRENPRDDRFLEGYVTAVVSRDFPLDKVSVIEVRDGVVTLSASGLAATQRGRVQAVVGEIQGVTRVEVVDAKDAAANGPVASVPQKEEGTTLLPKGVLFEPLRADPRWPRFSVAYRYFPSDKELDHVGAANFGESIALVRGPAFWDGHWEAGLQAGVFSIFDLASDSNDLVNADYWVGIPLTYRHGGFATMVRIFHQSSHLGDEYLLRGPTSRVNLSYEGFDLKFSQDLSDTLRIYAGAGYLFHREPSDLEPWSTQAGLELTSPWTIFSDSLRPLAAVDIQDHQESDWEPDVSVKAGVQWESLSVVDRKLSLMLEYYNGRNPNGQFYDRGIEFVGLSLSLSL